MSNEDFKIKIKSNLGIEEDILNKALEFRAYCVEYDFKDMEAVWDIGKILGMKLEIRLSYKKRK